MKKQLIKMNLKISKGIFYLIVGVVFIFAKFYDLRVSATSTPINYILSVLFIVIGLLEIKEAYDEYKYN